ncbi:hypothetical protein E2C01_087838 [Portunus trituberculatus]|uniref:Uncharacterized protein n=1 Tax=Portunus trituberculatus TaxID=210409 RepID=A0A5B7J976_PORTR|nr:hypothetical protein [Portunus trituberculatus]
MEDSPVGDMEAMGKKLGGGCVVVVDKDATLLRARRYGEAWRGGAGCRPFCQRPRLSVCRGAGLSHATRSSRREQPSELRRNICDSAVSGAKGVGIRGAADLHHRQLPRLPPPLSHATKE